MAITFSCSCGKMLRVADEHAGKKVKCPQCQQVSVAEAPPQFEVVEDDEPLPKPRAVAKAVSKSSDVEVDDDDDDDRPRRKKRRDDDEDDDDVRASRKRRRRDDDDDEDERPRRKKPRTKKSKKKQQSGAFATEKSIANGGVAIGLLVMLGAVVWFVIGFMNDRIFFYPPILFIVGLVAVIKGMLGIGGDDDE